MRVTVNKNNRIEQGIRPPMLMAVTLPVMIDGQYSGIALYVAASVFAQPLPTAKQVKDVADVISDRINGQMKRHQGEAKR